MAPNPRVVQAFNAMKALGISAEEVKPVLAELLRVYDKNWELIEEDNYRTLVDAYFDFKEDKGTDAKKKVSVNFHARERPKQKLHLIDDDDDDNQVLSTTNKSSQKLSIADRKTPPGNSSQEIIEPSQASKQDSKPRTSSEASHARLMKVERVSSSPCNAPKYRKTYYDIAPSSGHSVDYEKELVKPRTKKPKLQTQPISTNHDGLFDASSSCNNNATTSTGNITIASSPRGEVKLSLNCNSALAQPDFCNPNLDTVMKFMEEKYLSSCMTQDPQFSMVKLLNGLCRSYLMLGHKKRSNFRSSSSNLAVTQDERSSSQFINDITRGSEEVKIPLIDENGSEDLPKFNYIPQNIIYQSANVNISLARISDEGCCSDCSGNCLSASLPCACARETGGEFAYTPEGVLNEEFLKACISMKNEPQDRHFVYCQECPLEKSKNEFMPEQCKGHMVRKFIKECWRKCGCDMRCGNRVVQRGIRCKLQVYMTREGKGWGLRTLEDLPKGTFVCEYVGEILTNTELYERNVHSSCSNDRHTYPVTLDADWGSEGVLKDEEALCLDATYNGNVGRFINHRCFDANLIDIPVEVETPDHHYYHLAFFTTRDVRANEELTWDYGIDFDDHDHPIKAFQCSCGSAFCGDKKRKGNWIADKMDKNTCKKV
ncbi:histone-lysine N-methyltransferase SUVR4 [Arachis duranensis]|uniref:Histone-lysine N-methyltransferase SUVR4 n=1 Tax=Arachis duranensis TaxID=130453 RepID=A0A6P5M9R9_ARADU|nr:histone-lysine N-methyltransferase SUVR4 [Arachis duranensis]